MTYAFIKSVQHELQRLSCLEPGESNTIGSIDDKTKQAVMQFIYIVDLPSGSNIDNNFINALNLIINKPTIGADGVIREKDWNKILK